METRTNQIERKLRSTLLSWACVCAISLTSIVLQSCASVRTIYVPEGEPVQLRETIRKADVWVIDQDGKRTPGQMDLPEGWWALPDDGKAP